MKNRSDRSELMKVDGQSGRIAGWWIYLDSMDVHLIHAEHTQL